MPVLAGGSNAQHWQVAGVSHTPLHFTYVWHLTCMLHIRHPPNHPVGSCSCHSTCMAKCRIAVCTGADSPTYCVMPPHVKLGGVGSCVMGVSYFGVDGCHHICVSALHPTHPTLAAQDVVRRYKESHPGNWDLLPERVAFQVRLWDGVLAGDKGVS